MPSAGCLSSGVGCQLQLRLPSQLPLYIVLSAYRNHRCGGLGTVVEMVQRWRWYSGGGGTVVAVAAVAAVVRSDGVELKSAFHASHTQS